MKNYYGVDIKKQREKLINSEKAKVIINGVIDNADKALGKKYEALKFSDYMMFLETGIRTQYERGYFERRNDCSYLSVAYWITEDNKYKDTLIDLIFYICDEYTWCVPAHAFLLNDKPSSKEMIENIDLFQAETARLLTDIAVLVGEKLPYYVNDRIEYEIRRRIIGPIKHSEFHWQKPTCRTNWAAVCAGGVATALLCFGEDADINEAMPSLYSSVEHFLLGYNDDGCCMEGGVYWEYGFGYFVIFARLVYEYTKGTVNYFTREKVKNIATFIQKIRMGKSKAVSFSDSSSSFDFSPGLICCLKSIYQDDIVLPPLEFATYKGNVYSMKELLWFDADYSEGTGKEETTFFENAQWFIKSNECFCFAAKAGNNNEPHNHNDVGSFMIVTQNDDIPLIDLGAAIYTKETFEREHRYNMLNNSSRGHSVPIINGQYQGAEDIRYAAKNVKVGIDYFEADIENAYEEGLIKRINRRFELKEKSVLLCDTFEYSAVTEEIVERLVSCIKPEIHSGYVDLKTAKIMYDNEKYTVNISEDKYSVHTSNEPVKVYLIDFESKKGNMTNFEVEVLMDI